MNRADVFSSVKKKLAYRRIELHIKENKEHYLGRFSVTESKTRTISSKRQNQKYQKLSNNKLTVDFHFTAFSEEQKKQKKQKNTVMYCYQICIHVGDIFCTLYKPT